MNNIVRIASIVIFPMILLAGSFFVSPSGDNANDGSEGNPWKTIQYALNSISAGDTVLARAGQYNEIINFPKSGDETQGYITLKNYPGENPLIDGTGLMSSSDWPQGVIRIIDKNY